LLPIWFSQIPATCMSTSIFSTAVWTTLPLRSRTWTTSCQRASPLYSRSSAARASRLFGLELDDVAPRLDRRVGVHQVLGLDAADLGVVVARLLGAEDPRADGDERGERLVELHPRLALLVDAVQGGQGLDVAAVEVARGQPRVERVALLAEALAVDAAERLVDGDLVVLVADCVDLALEHLGQLLPALGALVQAGELAERERILAAEVDDLVPQVDRVGLAIQRLRGQLRHVLEAGGGVVIGVGDARHLLVGVEQVLPAAGRQVQRLEPLERLHVARVDVDRAVVGGDGGLGLASHCS
jgi:hypothetical protein